ncbi:MAG: hypothetical protein JST79_08185 [Acidobacteria bacterium]|nr:hypothetical protein [Acidobacteriota bacterium]
MVRFPVSVLRYRFLWRLRVPTSPSEVRRIERWLATARVALAICALVAIWMDPAEIRYSIWAYGLLGFYIIHGVVIMLLLRFRQESTSSFRLLVHAADIVWPALVSSFTGGQSNPFFLFFVFVLAAAAYRWGLWETLGTAVGAVLLLWAEGLAFDHGFVHWVNGALFQHHLPRLVIAVDDFEPKRLFMRSVYLVVLGLLLGFLAEQQKQLRAEKAVIARILGRANVESGLSGTLYEIMSDLLTLYGANGAIIASQESDSHHVFVCQVRGEAEGPSSLRWLDSSPSDRETYLFPSPADALFLYQRKPGAAGMESVALDAEGVPTREVAPEQWERLASKHPFQSAVIISFLFGREWSGRIFLLNPSLGGNTAEELHFLQELVRQVGPAVYNVYLLRRLRLRAGALERARFARELHDGAVQSLIAVEMQVDVLRRQADNRPDLVSGELGRIQGLLREEVLKLRELMQQLKTLDVDSRKILLFLEDTVERFQRETGISARFHSDLQQVDMPQPVCRELARIVQEGLVNVRKHSQARQVMVRLGSNQGAWKVVIEDNGRGFPFAGRFSYDELEKMGKGPLVIKERLRLINGQLTVESNPGQGARLEISVPQRRAPVDGY